MRKKIFFLMLFALYSFVHPVFAQKEMINVNYSTGTANVSIPLYTIQNGSVSVSISLVYNATGIKVKQVEGMAGMGWELFAGGEISRELRQLPDDCKKDKSSNARFGWLYNDNGYKINNFIISNDNDQSNCADETADLNYINTNFGDCTESIRLK